MSLPKLPGKPLPRPWMPRAKRAGAPPAPDFLCHVDVAHHLEYCPLLETNGPGVGPWVGKTSVSGASGGTPAGTRWKAEGR